LSIGKEAGAGGEVAGDGGRHAASSSRLCDEVLIDAAWRCVVLQ